MQLRLTSLGIVWLAALALSAAGADTERFQFREPRVRSYRVETQTSPFGNFSALARIPSDVWLKAWPEDGSTNYVEFNNRVVLQLKQPGDPTPLLAGQSLRLARRVTDTTFILEGSEALIALREAEKLSQHAAVAACYPIARRRAQLHGPYARRPSDPYVYQPGLPAADWQWHLENRDTNGASAGVDLNARAAWPFSRGEGVILAIADDGFELDHPDLAPQVEGTPHFNFHTRSTNAGPSGRFSNHATAVAGLAAASGDNGVGVSGVAPRVRLASWVLFDRFGSVPDEESMMDMFQYASNIVSVQNHSWGNSSIGQLLPSTIEQIGVSNAVNFGREGRGVVIVRSAGNGRGTSGNANDDGYASDPNVIAVGAVRFDGRVTRYSNPGACVLVAAPSGDEEQDDNPCLGNTPNLFTTDRQGSAGYTSIADTDDLTNYAFGPTGFSGTSGTAPQISGLVALILAANPNLAVRDVQQILLHSARHPSAPDPDLRTNGAGFVVSDNVGFGVPDAGRAVTLARHWSNRPPLTVVTYSDTNATAIPDLGLRLLVIGKDLPPELASISALPGSGVHPDVDTPLVPITDIGLALNTITDNLSGQAAFIRRGTNFFCDKLTKAAQAGAAFAVVYNNRDRTERIIMGGTDFVPIPAVMINQNDGEALQSWIQNDPNVRVRLHLETARYSFEVKETLLCEHVGVRVDTDHSRRRDVRITLVSPMGTRSVLQHVNSDNLAGPVNWTYYSVQHFFESSAGLWTVEISDEDDTGIGEIKSVSLTIQGVPITDSDRDGLDDFWEQQHFGVPANGPRDDPDHDGLSNAREQILGSNPTINDEPFQLDLSVWDERLVRLSWPGQSDATYQVRSTLNPIAPLTTVTNIPGVFPETEWFVPRTEAASRFFRVGAVPPQ